MRPNRRSQPAAVADAGDQARAARRAAFARLALAHFDLQKLDGASGGIAPALHAQQIASAAADAVAQRRDQGVGGGHRVLNRQVDAHALIGDMACAASPMHSTPGLAQRSDDRCECSAV